MPSRQSSSAPLTGSLRDNPHLKSLQAFARAMTELQKVYPNMSISQAQTFMTIGMMPGTSQVEVAQTTATSVKSVSRHVKELKELDLIVQDYDLMDPRKAVLTLTPRGKRVNASIHQIINPED